MESNGSSAPAAPLDSFGVGTHSSSITYHDGHIWGVEHNADGGGGIVSYPVGSDGALQTSSVNLPVFGPVYYTVSDGHVDGPDRMQGIAVDDHYIYVSQSLYRDSDDSQIMRIDRHSGDLESVDVPSNMLEGIALHGGKLVQLYESGANAYEHGEDGEGRAASRGTPCRTSTWTERFGHGAPRWYRCARPIMSSPPREDVMCK